MKKTSAMLILLLFVTSIYAQDTIVLKSRKNVKGALQGFTNDRVGIVTDDGVISHYPTSLVKSIFRGKTDITYDVYNNAPYLKLPLNSEYAPETDSLQTQVSETVLLSSQLTSISNRLEMIALPMWIGIAVGTLSWLLSL
jgi:hypothetical protein